MKVHKSGRPLILLFLSEHPRYKNKVTLELGKFNRYVLKVLEFHPIGGSVEKNRTWGFYNLLGEELPPLVFSNGKNQQSIVEEIIQAFKSNDIVFLKALVVSGKSVIATTICKLMGRGIIVVPVKKLQEELLRLK